MPDYTGCKRKEHVWRLLLHAGYCLGLCCFMHTSFNNIQTCPTWFSVSEWISVIHSVSQNIFQSKQIAWKAKPWFIKKFHLILGCKPVQLHLECQGMSETLKHQTSLRPCRKSSGNPQMRFHEDGWQPWWLHDSGLELLWVSGFLHQQSLGSTTVQAVY